MNPATSSLTRNLNLPAITEHSHDVFTELHRERRDWEVGTLGSEWFTVEIPGVPETFQRIAALGLELELPVGSFIRQALEERDRIPPTALAGMVANIEDEEKHHAAFKAIASIHRPSQEHLAQAAQFRKILVKDKHKPILKSRDLETIVFIPVQTALRFFGGQALERLVADISHDEYRHIQYGWELSAALGIGLSKEVSEIALSIIEWCFQPLAREHRYGFEFWIQSAKNMSEWGESEELVKLMSYGIHRAPFEIDNSNY